MKFLIITFCLLNLFTTDSKQDKFFSRFEQVAIDEYHKYGILPSIKLAQAAQESGWGKSDAATVYNAYFGIKCKTCTNRFFYKGDWYRGHDNAWESFRKHSKFLHRDRYKVLFTTNNYNCWAHLLYDCGYATDPNYSKALIRIIEDNKLYLIDQKVLK